MGKRHLNPSIHPPSHFDNPRSPLSATMRERKRKRKTGIREECPRTANGSWRQLRLDRPKGGGIEEENGGRREGQGIGVSTTATGARRTADDGRLCSSVEPREREGRQTQPTQGKAGKRAKLKAQSSTKIIIGEMRRRKKAEIKFSTYHLSILHPALQYRFRTVALLTAPLHHHF